MESVTQVQILIEADWISFHQNALEKGVNSYDHPSPFKYFVSLVRQPYSENFVFKPNLIGLKIDPMSYPTYDGGVW